MKFCEKCGNELLDEAVVCPKCGCPVGDPIVNAPVTQKKASNASFVLGIIGIVTAWLISVVGHITSIIGIVLGIKEYRQSGRSVGLTMSIAGEVCAIANTILRILIVVWVCEYYQSLLNDLNAFY